MSHSVFSLRGVMALAFTLVSACGGGGGPGFLEPPPIPKANLVASATTIRLGESITLTGSCTPVAAASSSTKSWPSPSPSASMNFSEVVTPTSVGVVKYTLTCVGSSGSSTAEVSVTVLPPLPPPSISGRIFLPSPGDVTNTIVYITLGAVTDSADVGADGRYTLPNRLSTADSVDILVKDKSANGIQFHPSLAAVLKKDFGKSQDFIRVPRSWTVSKGVFVGTTVPIDLVLAYTPSAPGDVSFYFRNLQNGLWHYALACIPKSKMPMPWAINREGSNLPVDSVGFSAAIDTMEMVLGQDVFRPANISDLLPNQGLRVSVDSTIPGSGIGGASLSSTFPYQSVIGGSVSFIATLLSGATVTVEHEVSHAMAFGHTCSWKTRMNSGCDKSKVSFTGLTATDIAYMEVMKEVCEIGMATSAPYSIPEAFEGLKKERGLAREAIWRP